jgi:hypothetical protein
VGLARYTVAVRIELRSVAGLSDVQRRLAALTRLSAVEHVVSGQAATRAIGRLGGIARRPRLDDQRRRRASSDEDENEERVP